MTRIGIGIATYNRLPLLQQVVAALRRHTRSGCLLLVADDGSSDGTVDWVRAEGILCITGDQRGVARNKNRLLWRFLNDTDCDTIILLEDDVEPSRDEWEVTWASAARRWGQVCYPRARDLSKCNVIQGRGLITDPYFCAHFGAQCVATSRAVLEQIGFLDPRFKGYGLGHVEWTLRVRKLYRDVWGEGIPCLTHGLKLLTASSWANVADATRNHAVFIRRDLERVWCDPWCNEGERAAFLAEQEAT